jgi:hypothetical protein
MAAADRPVCLVGKWRPTGSDLAVRSAWGVTSAGRAPCTRTAGAGRPAENARGEGLR